MIPVPFLFRKTSCMLYPCQGLSAALNRVNFLAELTSDAGWCPPSTQNLRRTALLSFSAEAAHASLSGRTIPSFDTAVCG